MKRQQSRTKYGESNQLADKIPEDEKCHFCFHGNALVIIMFGRSIRRLRIRLEVRTRTRSVWLNKLVMPCLNLPERKPGPTCCDPLKEMTGKMQECLCEMAREHQRQAAMKKQRWLGLIWMNEWSSNDASARCGLLVNHVRLHFICNHNNWSKSFIVQTDPTKRFIVTLQNLKQRQTDCLITQ